MQDTTGCPFCDEKLQQLGEPDVCGACLALIWHVKIAVGRYDWCDLDGHSKVNRLNHGKVVQTGHRTQLEPHTEARCRNKRVRGIFAPPLPQLY